MHMEGVPIIQGVDVQYITNSHKMKIVEGIADPLESSIIFLLFFSLIQSNLMQYAPIFVQ